jgi:hypothetical protein
MTDTTKDAARVPDVNDLANVAEEVPVDPENVRLIRPDIDNDPDDQHLSTANPILAEYMARARAEQKAGKMTSERQKEANRSNVRHSTGPKTPEGKAAVRLNAVQHGLLARDAVLPGEDADAFEDLWNEVWAELSPVGPIEELLVERIINSIWRLRRSARVETALFHWRVYWLKADRLRERVGSYVEPPIDTSLFVEIRDKASHSEAKEALAEVEAERDRDEVLLGCAFDADAKEGNTLAKLARYEARLERSLFRNLNELRKLQDKRRNRRSLSISDAVTLDANDTQAAGK